MNLLNKIRRQPEHIREIFMWLFVVIVFSVVLLAGFRQTERNLVALANPEQKEKKMTQLVYGAKSPLASFGGYFNDLRASIADIFQFGGETENKGQTVKSPKTEIPPALLPLGE